MPGKGSFISEDSIVREVGPMIDSCGVWTLKPKARLATDPVTSALNVVTVGPKHIFSNALRGKVMCLTALLAKWWSRRDNYACCRFTLSEPYVLVLHGHDRSIGSGKLVSTGLAIDSRECLGAVVSTDESLRFTSKWFCCFSDFGQKPRHCHPSGSSEHHDRSD